MVVPRFIYFSCGFTTRLTTKPWPSTEWGSLLTLSNPTLEPRTGSSTLSTGFLDFRLTPSRKNWPWILWLGKFDLQLLNMIQIIFSLTSSAEFQLFLKNKGTISKRNCNFDWKFSSSVYSLGKQNHFNKMFANKKEKFTYLVPSDEAWRHLHKSFATVHKILFMGDFSYQVKKQQIWI